MEKIQITSELLIRSYFAMAALFTLICLVLLSKQYFKKFFKKDLKVIFKSNIK